MKRPDRGGAVEFAHQVQIFHTQACTMKLNAESFTPDGTSHIMIFLRSETQRDFDPVDFKQQLMGTHTPTPTHLHTHTVIKKSTSLRASDGTPHALVCQDTSLYFFPALSHQFFIEMMFIYMEFCQLCFDT